MLRILAFVACISGRIPVGLHYKAPGRGVTTSIPGLAEPVGWAAAIIPRFLPFATKHTAIAGARNGQRGSGLKRCPALQKRTKAVRAAVLNVNMLSIHIYFLMNIGPRVDTFS
jgi:hypothetical protein